MGAELRIDARHGPLPALGDGVVGRVGSLTAGEGVRIGLPQDAAFRRTAGVRIELDELTLESGVVIEREVELRGKRLHLGKNVRIKAGTTISAVDSLEIRAGGTVGEDCEITVYRGVIGRQLWMLPNAKIGGGSATDVDSELAAGPWLHLGVHTLLNTARKITLGREVGIGTRSSLYTHGAYPSMLRGAPVAFAPIAVGDFTWIPGAVVNPGVTIGRHCVVGVNSLVARDLPDGCLAGGSPAKVIKENVYPKRLSDAETDAKVRGFLRDYARALTNRHAVEVRDETDAMAVRIDAGRAVITWRVANDGPAAENELRIGRTAQGGRFNASLDALTLAGAADADVQRLVNQLRRYGVRFDYEPAGGAYVPWPAE